MSIIACFISLGQIFYYTSSFFQFFYRSLSMGWKIITVSTIGLLALLLPLMLTSFYCIRTNIIAEDLKESPAVLLPSSTSCCDCTSLDSTLC